MTRIYKVCGSEEWAAAEVVGSYDGSADDRRDGFVHLSTASQLAGTLSRHFAGRDDLLLVALDSEALGNALQWEPSRGGDLFPHLYGALPTNAALWIKPLPCDPHGSHLIPPEAR
jgi:uncharacterized protein (DUF952 family)